MTDKGPTDWLEPILATLPRARVAVFGDFALDAYWTIDPDRSELSVETGLPVQRVSSQRYSCGGAANVAVNLCSLGVGSVRAVGMLGDDLFGRELESILSREGVDTTGLLRCQEDWQTQAFAKPHEQESELNRIDFGNLNSLSVAAAERLEQELDRVAADSDVVILNQQVPIGVSTEAMIERLNGLVARHPGRRFIVDSRDRPGSYQAAMLKINDLEVMRLGGESAIERPVSLARLEEIAGDLYEQRAESLFITRGEQGMLVFDEGGAQNVAGVAIGEPVDPVGAGDTALAAIAAALAGGSPAVMAARLANLAAAVTVGKLRTTGTASPDELRAALR